LREFWAPVRDDPHDFDAWTRLLQFVEQKNDPESAEDAFDAFLKLYPFCYGYWRKYAELQKRNHRYEKALNVSYIS
jgi:pre-mRNA-processing factor 39